MTVEFGPDSTRIVYQAEILFVHFFKCEPLIGKPVLEELVEHRFTYNHWCLLLIVGGGDVVNGGQYADVVSRKSKAGVIVWWTSGLLGESIAAMTTEFSDWYSRVSCTLHFLP
jgi:hypothetical protein